MRATSVESSLPCEKGEGEKEVAREGGREEEGWREGGREGGTEQLHDCTCKWVNDV